MSCFCSPRLYACAGLAPENFAGSELHQELSAQRKLCAWRLMWRAASITEPFFSLSLYTKSQTFLDLAYGSATLQTIVKQLLNHPFNLERVAAVLRGGLLERLHQT